MVNVSYRLQAEVRPHAPDYRILDLKADERDLFELGYQYLRQFGGIACMVNAPQCSHVGNGLINKKQLWHFRKQFEGFQPLFPATAPRLQIIHTPLRPLRAHRTPQGVGDIDHEHGEIRPVVPRRLLDRHEIFQAPLLFGSPKVELQLETKTIIVQPLIPGKGQVPTE